MVYLIVSGFLLAGLFFSLMIIAACILAARSDAVREAHRAARQKVDNNDAK